MTSAPCEHDYVYQGIVYEDQDAYTRYFYHLYYCRKCLATHVKYFETSTLHNRFDSHPHPTATLRPR